jgi:hypothetical protein
MATSMVKLQAHMTQLSLGVDNLKADFDAKSAAVERECGALRQAWEAQQRHHAKMENLRLEREAEAQKRLADQEGDLGEREADLAAQEERLGQLR